VDICIFLTAIGTGKNQINTVSANPIKNKGLYPLSLFFWCLDLKVLYRWYLSNVM